MPPMSADAALYQPDERLLTIAAILIGAWYVMLAVFAAIRWPKLPRPDPPTTEFRDEPPAVANLLCNGWAVTEDAVPATLLDLAARDFVTIEDRGDQELICRVRTRPPSDALQGYETQVLDHLRKLTSDGYVPAGALTTGPQDESRRWWDAFKRSVRDDAKGRGLARDLWPPRLSLFMIVLGVPIVFFVMAAQGFKPEEEVQQTSFLTAVTFAMWGGLVPLFYLTGTSRLRDTDAGRRAAAHWLGVREALETLPSLPELTAGAVPTWERHLAYGAALGVAGRAVKTLPFGAEHDRRVWTDYGGKWKQIQVRYPQLRPGWGAHPALAVALGIVRLVVTGGLMWFVSQFLSNEFLDVGPWGRFIAGAFLAGLLALGVWSFVWLVWAIFDLGASPIDVEGEVVRTRVKESRSSSNENSNPRYFVAIYNGEGDTVDAFRVSDKLYPSFVQGEIAKLTVTPKLGYVRSSS